MQRNLALVNDFFKSKRDIANCMTDRTCIHAGNATEQFLHRNETLNFVTTVLELLTRSKNLSSTV